MNAITSSPSACAATTTSVIAGSDQEHTFPVTFFRSVTAKEGTEKVVSLSGLAAQIRSTAAPTKKDLPLLKFAQFGTNRSSGGGLRHNENVIAITGVEGDYDAGTMPVDDAIRLLGEAGLLCLVYTTPSNTPQTPRWRVLAPLSRRLPTQQHDGLVRRLNGILNGALASESATLSQPYYFGSTSSSGAVHLEIVEGGFLDERDGLPEHALGAALPVAQVQAKAHGSGAHPLAGPRPDILAGVCADGGVQAMQAGMGRDGWFMELPSARRVEFLQAALTAVAPICGGRENWMRVIRAMRSVGEEISEAHDLALVWSRDEAPGFTGVPDFEKAWQTSPPKEAGTTVGSLISMAKAAGMDLASWQGLADAERALRVGQAPTVAVAAGTTIAGVPHTMDQAVALAWGNSRFAYLHEWNSLVVQEKPGVVRPINERAFGMLVKNRKVKLVTDNTTKAVPFGPWWLEQPQRREVDSVAYDPENKLSGNFLNLDQGLGVTPRRGRCGLMIRHIHRVICRRDKAAFRYLIRWLAHCVQHRGTKPGVVVILQSRSEGTGKSTLGDAMVRMLGAHGKTVATPEAILGDFNGLLAAASFVQASECSFAGDRDMARRLKAIATDESIYINEKFQPGRHVPNVLHLLITTNEKCAVDAGPDARRFFILDVSAEQRGRTAYFDGLYRQMETGGLEAFAHFLMRIDLRGWNPRNVPKTEALRQTQLERAPLVTRWALACAGDGRLLGGGTPGSGTSSVNWPGPVTANQLCVMITAWKRDSGTFGDVPSGVTIGRWLKGVGATQTRGTTGARAREWIMPALPAFEGAVHMEAGIGL